MEDPLPKKVFKDYAPGYVSNPIAPTQRETADDITL